MQEKLKIKKYWRNYIFLQDKYIINEKYKIDMNQIKDTLQSIKEKFSNIDI